MTCQEFCEAISFHSWTMTLSALGRIRVQHKLDASAETEVFLKTLAFELEVRQRVAKAKRRDKSGSATKAILSITTSEKTKKEDIRNCAKRLLIIEPIVLDEFYLLLQDIQKARQNLPDTEHT